MATNSAAQFPYYYKSSSGDSTKWLDYLTAQYTNPSQAQLPSNTMAAQPQVASADQSTLGALQQNASSTVAASAPAAASNPTPASTSLAAIPAGLTDPSSTAGATKPAEIPGVNTGASQQTADNPYAGVSSFALQHSYDQSNPQVQSAKSAQATLPSGTSGYSQAVIDFANSERSPAAQSSGRPLSAIELQGALSGYERMMANQANQAPNLSPSSSATLPDTMVRGTDVGPASVLVGGQPADLASNPSYQAQEAATAGSSMTPGGRYLGGNAPMDPHMLSSYMANPQTLKDPANAGSIPYVLSQVSQLYGPQAAQKLQLQLNQQ